MLTVTALIALFMRTQDLEAQARSVATEPTVLVKIIAVHAPTTAA
jgi:hypothetical protein